MSPPEYSLFDKFILKLKIFYNLSLNIYMNDKLKDYKKYFTRFNFTKPYLVYVKKNVYVYEKENKFKNSKIDEEYMYTKLIKCFNPEKIFIGKADKSKYNGNSFLLKIDKYKYVFIGNKIQQFKVKDDEILKFYSPLLKNDTPYPFAIGKKNIYSFIFPEGYLPKEHFTNLKIDNLLDELLKYEPQLLSFKNHKSKSNFTIEQTKKLLNKNKKDITLDELKKLAKDYKVTISGSKAQLFNRLSKLRNIKFK